MSEISVTATRRTINKIVSYAQAAYDEHKAEIGGMAVCVKLEDNEWRIESPVILKQEITGSTCTLDKDELAAYYVDTHASKKYKNKDYRFIWWHSHHMMDSFWSGTDLNAIDEYSDGDLSFALVVNLKGKYLVRASAWDLGMHLDMELGIVEAQSSVSDKVLNEVNEKCSTRKAISSYKPVNVGNWKKKKVQSEEEDAFISKWNEVYEAVEEAMTETIRGNMTIKGMKENFDTVNSTLKEEKYPIQINYNGLDTLSDIIALEPDRVIENDKKFDEIVSTLVMDQMDMFSYNWSYGLGRRYN
jgi:hypothetical protein